MSEQTKYPKRGQTSSDGKTYTDHDGTVHVWTPRRLGEKCEDANCSMFGKESPCPDPAEDAPCGWLKVEGAYVPSDDVLEACEMARKAIVMCSVRDDSECDGCYEFHNKSCHLRLFLAAHGDQKAWEVAK